LVGAKLNFCIHPPLTEPIWYRFISLVNVSVENWALDPKYTMINNIIKAWNYRICIGCLTSLLHFSALRWWYAWCQSWQLNFIYGLYSFQTMLFCIIILEVRSSVGTDWLLRGPILLKTSLHDINAKVSILKFMFYPYVLELIWLRIYMILILMSNCKVWIVVVASKSFYFCWIFCLTPKVLWWFQAQNCLKTPLLKASYSFYFFDLFSWIQP
jgi:hypothetical protein